MPTTWTEAQLDYLAADGSIKVTGDGVGDPLASVPLGDVRAWAAAWESVRADYEARAARWHEARGESPEGTTKARQLAELGRMLRRAELADLGYRAAKAQQELDCLMGPLRERWAMAEKIDRLERQLYAS